MTAAAGTGETISPRTALALAGRLRQGGNAPCSSSFHQEELMSNPDRPDPIHELPIRTRETYTRQGTRKSEEIVSCPLRGAAMTPDDCGHCGRCESVVYGSDGRSVVRCELPPDLIPAPDRGGDADVTLVTALMTDEVVCVRPELRVRALAELLGARQIGGAPVVDGNGRVIGMVSKTDIVEVHGRDADLLVGDIMMSVAFTLDEQATIAQAAAMMAVEGVHRIPIVTRSGDVVGIVSALDVLRWVAGRHGYAPEIRSSAD
jgi:CBS domain-containing protein